MMNKKRSDISLIINNDGGVAIIMVLSAIVLLTTIMMNFSFDSNINRIKAYNIENKGQAKLTAESGLQFAMARLRLYKEAFNYLEQNTAAKDFATPEVLNSIWNFPFIYPIPTNSTMNAIQKESIAKFTENTFLQGTLKLTINNLSQKINLNLLRISLIAEAIKAEAGTDPNGANDDGDEEFNVESQLVNSLKFSIERKSIKDDDFSGKYTGIDPVNLVNMLKVYLSDPDTLDDDGGASSEFDEQKLTIKKAPVSSFSEIYTLPNWDDDLIDLIKGEFTVYGALMIDLNKITDKMLRILIPTITDEEVKEFFEYRDDAENPKFFNKSEDFKNYIVNVGNVLSSTEYDDRIAKFEKQGLRFGPTPSLFKVISVGVKDRATYTLVAYISIPAKPATKVVQNPNQPTEPENPTTPPVDPPETDPPETDPPETNPDDDKTKEKTQLLEPRILEIFIS